MGNYFHEATVQLHSCIGRIKPSPLKASSVSPRVQRAAWSPSDLSWSYYCSCRARTLGGLPYSICTPPVLCPSLCKSTLALDQHCKHASLLCNDKLRLRGTNPRQDKRTASWAKTATEWLRFVPFSVGRGKGWAVHYNHRHYALWNVNTLQSDL